MHPVLQRVSRKSLAIREHQLPEFLANPSHPDLLWRAHAGTGALGHAPAGTQALVLGTGVVTAVPLLCFAYGARRLRLTTLGLLQYAAPTVQFALGVLVFHETFDAHRAQSFAFIWAGLAVYSVDALWSQRRMLRGAK